MPAAMDIRAAVARYLEALTLGSPAGVAALYADDATVEDPAGSPPHRGRAAIETFYGPLEFGQTSTELLAVRIAGDSAAVHFRVVTRAGDQTFAIEPIDIMTFDDHARITSMRAYWSAEDITHS